MLNRAHVRSGLSSAAGTLVEDVVRAAIVNRPIPPTTRQALRNHHTVTSDSTIFIIGQFAPQMIVSPANRASPADGNAVPAGVPACGRFIEISLAGGN